MKSNRKKLLGLAVVLGCVSFISPSSYSDNDEKVTICHKGRTLKVAKSAVRAHLAHGDTMGPCEVTPNRNK